MRQRVTTLLAAFVLVCSGILALGLSTDHGKAAAAAGSSVHFTTAGDFGSSDTAAGVLAGMASVAPDFGLALGDLSYGADGTESSWCNLVRSKMGPSTPFELVAGNHESNGLNGNIDNFAACLPNGLPGLVGTYGKEWYVDVPASAPIMRIIMISPNLQFPSGKWNYTVGSSHYNWTAAAIDGAHAANIPWVVVGMHEPCLALTIADCSSGSDLMNLLVAKKVDLVLSGHVHMYARTKQLGYSQSCTKIIPNTSSAACIADADNDMRQGGTVFATVGTGGEEEQTPNPRDPEAPYFAASSASKAWGFLDVTADSGHLSAAFDRTSGAALNDSFTITRNSGPSPAFTSSCNNLACSFDASGSVDPGSAITSYAWRFGDGAQGTGVAPGHTYASAGTYSATLTITDQNGTTASITHVVNVVDGATGTGGDVTFVGAGSVSGGAVRSEQVALPAQAQAGDVAVAFFAGSGSWSGPTGITGWTSLGSFTTAANTTTAWFKALGAGDLGKAVRMDTSDYHKGVLDVAVYSGVDPAGVLATHASDTNRSAHAGPAIDAPDGSWVLSYWSDKSAATTSWSAPASVTVRRSVSGVGSGRYSSLLTDSGRAVAGGAYGPLTATANATSTSAHAWSIALPAADGGSQGGGGGGGGGSLSFVGAASVSGGATRAEQVALPAGAQAGDVVVVICTATGSWTAPSGVTGLTQLGSFDNGSSSTSAVWIASLSQADLGQSIRITTADYHKAVLTVAVYSGADASAASAAHTADTNRSAHAGPVISPPSGSWVVSYWADKSGATTSWSAPAGVTVRDTTFGTGSGRYAALLADSGAAVAGGTYGPLTSTANATSTSAEAWTVTLPAA